MFIVILFVVLVGGGWLIGKSIGEALFPSEKDKYTFIDKSVHHHHHHHEHKNISIIDDVTKKKIFELKESKDGK
jgi:hypothetical protein